MWPHAFPLLSWTLLIVFAIATPNPLPVGPPHCDKDYYGSPKIEDCKQAIFWIPKSGPNAVANHVFAEPQLLNPPFKAVKNPNAPRAIIQLPKIFKYGASKDISSASKIVPSFSGSDFECTLLGSCSIAIVVQPYGYGIDKRLKPEFTYTWSNIANQVLRLQTCLVPPRTVEDRTPQGGYKPLVSEFSLH